MIKEAYCSFEVAKLLKEKGFDKFIDYGWDEQLFDKKHPRSFSLGFDNKEHWISCPTHQLAMKWLRENGIIIEILHVTSKPVNDGWFYSYQKNNDSETNLIEYPAYEQAVEAALKYCLQNLI